MENSESFQQRNSVKSNSWTEKVINDISKIELGSRLLLRHPKCLTLIQCKVIAIYSEIEMGTIC